MTAPTAASGSVPDYPDEQMRQELVGFFGWKVEAVRKLSIYELAAWKRHAVQLRRVGFWWPV